jgi:antitoxin (DNA-binding transcriptional repressor) of toxin-antitoxin stability system
MCYMASTSHAATDVPVGVRELRQNLSVYLARVAAGSVFRVTDRGHVVALLVPVPAHATTAERLVASGRAVPPARDLLDLGPPIARPRTSLTEALRQVREDRL